MRRALVYAPLTALVFLLAGSWLGPKGISYWFTPPVLAGAPATFSCTPSINWAMDHLLDIQLICTGGGLLLGVLLTWWINGRAAKKEAARLEAAKGESAKGTPVKSEVAK